MKTTKRIVISAIVVLSILFAFLTMAHASDNAAESILSKEKDGLKAELVITNGADLTVKVTNVSGENVSNIKAEVILPEGLSLVSGSLSKDLALAIGESGELALSLEKIKETEPETTPETSPETDPETTPAAQSGCKGTVVSVVSVIAVAGIAVILAKKNKKSTISCLMLGAMLLGSFAFAVPTSAATTRRSIDLVGVVTVDGEEYPLNVSVSYDHTFTSEAAGKTATGFKEFDITYYFGPPGSDLND